MKTSAPTPEAPATQLLSAERLQRIADRLNGPKSVSGINEQLDGRALLAHLDAYQAQVRDTLRAMLPPMKQLRALDAPATTAMAAHYDDLLRAAAARLHLGEL